MTQIDRSRAQCRFLARNASHWHPLKAGFRRYRRLTVAAKSLRHTNLLDEFSRLSLRAAPVTNVAARQNTCESATPVRRRGRPVLVGFLTFLGQSLSNN